MKTKLIPPQISLIFFIFCLAINSCKAGTSENDDAKIRGYSPGSSGVLFVGEDGTGTVTVSKGDGDGKNTTLTVNCEFDQDHIKKAFSFPITFSGDGPVKESFTIPTDKVGYWRIEASTNSSSTVYSGAAVVVKPPDYNVSNPDSFFGTMLIKNFEAADRIGIKVDRHMALWSVIERVQGTYDWSKIDEMVNRAAEHHVGVMLDIVPNVSRPLKLPWATWTRDADLLNEPQHTYYKNFLTALVTRYKGKLAGIELFNEPDLEYFKLVHEDMNQAVDFTEKLDKESYDIIKSIDPDVPVIGLSVSGVDFRNDMQFTKAAIHNSGSPMMDVFGGHGYAPGHFIDDNNAVVYPDQYDLNGKIKAVLDAMRERGMTPRFWGTEIGYAYPFGTDPLSDDSGILRPQRRRHWYR